MVSIVFDLDFELAAGRRPKLVDDAVLVHDVADLTEPPRAALEVPKVALRRRVNGTSKFFSCVADDLEVRYEEICEPTPD